MPVGVLTPKQMFFMKLVKRLGGNISSKLFIPNILTFQPAAIMCLNIMCLQLVNNCMREKRRFKILEHMAHLITDFY